MCSFVLDGDDYGDVAVQAIINEGNSFVIDVDGRLTEVICELNDILNVNSQSRRNMVLKWSLG